MHLGAGFKPLSYAIMEIGSEDWSQLIIDGAAEFGLAISSQQIQQLTLHAKELLFWNRKINLTAITEPHEVAVKHILDSLACAAFLPATGTILDIGSGGGFPAIPLKIVCPSLRFWMIEASRKKANFLKHIIRALTLEDSQAHHLRAEDMACEDGYPHYFDVIVSRALSSLETFMNLSLPLLKPGGVLIGLKGPGAQPEIEAETKRMSRVADATADQGHTIRIEEKKYALPFLKEQRILVIMKSCL